MQYINNRSNGILEKKLASTVYNVGDALIYNGLGQVVPATGGVPVVGVVMEQIAATDSDYAVTRDMSILESVPNDELVINVATGAALATMVGSTFDIDAADPSSIDVSVSGTDILITRFINASTVFGKIV